MKLQDKKSVKIEENLIHGESENLSCIKWFEIYI